MDRIKVKPFFRLVPTVMISGTWWFAQNTCCIPSQWALVHTSLINWIMDKNLHAEVGSTCRNSDPYVVYSQWHMNSWNLHVKMSISCGSEETLTKDECTTTCWHTHMVSMQIGGFERNSWWDQGKHAGSKTPLKTISHISDLSSNSAYVKLKIGCQDITKTEMGFMCSKGSAKHFLSSAVFLLEHIKSAAKHLGVWVW